MSNLLRLAVLVVSVVLVSLPVRAEAPSPYAEAIRSFSLAGECAEYFRNSYGYAVFPNVGKAGLIVGGAHGEGRVIIGTKHVGDATMTQLTAGYQIGGQVFSQIIFFENEQAFNYFTSENFEFSAQATAVALTAGVSAEANTGGGAAAGISGGSNNASTTHGGYRKGMAIFTIAKGGLMYEAVLGGQTFSYTPL